LTDVAALPARASDSAADSGAAAACVHAAGVARVGSCIGNPACRLAVGARARDFNAATIREAVNGEYCEPRLGDLAQLLADFARALDVAGLPAPGGTADVERFFRDGMFADPHHKLAALGQHHGLPTALLDWTRVGTYAAYFAASDLADLERDDPDALLDVWALKAKDWAIRGKVGGSTVIVDVVQPPRVGNANLHSQGGVFTLTRTQADLRDRDAALPIIAVDEVARAGPDDPVLTKWMVTGTVMRRLSLPRREARDVLRLLACERIAGTALFPGLDGVVRWVRDDRHKR